MAAHWNQRRKPRNSSALWGVIVERAGGFIGPREAGSRGRGVQQEPNRMDFTCTEASPYPTPWSIHVSWPAMHACQRYVGVELLLRRRHRQVPF